MELDIFRDDYRTVGCTAVEIGEAARVMVSHSRYLKKEGSTTTFVIEALLEEGSALKFDTLRVTVH